MDDPLTRALNEAPTKKSGDPVPDVVDQNISHPRPVSGILEDVKNQALAALVLPFFDGGTDTDRTPIICVGATEAGTVHISASRLHPFYHTDLTLYVRSEVSSADDGRYQVRAECVLSCEAEGAQHRHEFPIAVRIGEGGALTIDVAQMRGEMANAIREFKASPSA
jgi:hypothetical protein